MKGSFFNDLIAGKSYKFRLQPTFEHWRSGSEALIVCPAADAFRILESEFTGFY